jgi:hypothetical protein
VLASKVSGLTSLGLRSIAHDELAAVGGVEVRCCGSAIAVGRDGESVDVPGGVTQLVYLPRALYSDLSYQLKGPYWAWLGRPERLTVKRTP